MFIPFSFIQVPIQNIVTTGSTYYNFTTFTFTNAGATGRQGPTYTQLTASYAPTASWVTSSQFFAANTRGIQEWTVPETATYRITAAGAAGGDTPTLNFSGGFGAVVTADIPLSQSQKLLIVVGQRGTNRFTGSGASTFNGASGGGGTFVYDSASITYYFAIGGGGGAAGATANLFSNQLSASGKFNTTSGSSIFIGATFSASGGFGGSGGGRSNRGILYGGPGAGINSSGSFANGGQGLSRAGNWLGGTTGSVTGSVPNSVEGGFGGGGSAVDGDAGADPLSIGLAGGGGGYSGGAAGGNSGQSNSSYGGGGGSFYTGSFVTGSNNLNRGHGYVTITKL